ncbi:'Cold-shock' DNA-binding domain-containing protein [Flavimobilis marinus]|uniref:'Cold-shock' DNA-binding domain-containing protein n=2 Tax=Flavimobilis marinus TaxID=285351 RepID=A0A1I2F0E6_9MICO|nr:'Cold-shock' DNA-binding domain-containing protein [Flavimobilis marinus]
MSRARLFALIESFEQDMRALVDRYVLDHLSEQEALADQYDNADERRQRDAPEVALSIATYLDLRPCYDVLNRHRAGLPHELAIEIRENTSMIDRVAPIRNRVMHGRPLKTDDPAIALSALSAYQSRFWRTTDATLRRLRDDELWEPIEKPLPLPSETVLHNLPYADYDETGLIGREQDTKQLVAMLKRRRDHVITITGEGGVGKTALALELAYAMVDDPESPYDCVLWSSLKSERLTTAGVIAISDAIEGIAGATRQLGRALDASFDGSVHELAESLEGLDALIVIDNLESVNGDEVLRLYDAMPPCVSFLFTSRIGIGELERRYRLGPLAASSATLLLRKFAMARGVSSLARLSSETAESVVERLRFSPLAIRWFTLSVEAGVDPLTTIRDQKELLTFCVANVFEQLSPEAKDLITIIRVLDRSAPLDELALLADLEIDQLRRAAQELSRGSLITYGSDASGGLASRIGPSLALRAFLPRESMESERLAGLLKRETDYRKSAERRRENDSRRSLAPWNVFTRGDEDEPAAYLLHKALVASKRKKYEEAFALTSKARELNPEFYENDRVEAFVASAAGEATRAVDLYRGALEKCDTDESRAVVSHYFAGHLARAMHDVPLAITYESMSHQHFKTKETAVALGNLLVWDRQFSEGQILIESAIEDADGMGRLIAVTALVESWRRWSEQLFNEHRYSDAYEHARTGFSVGVRELSGLSDRRLARAVVDALVAAVRYLAARGADLPRHSSSAVAMLEAAASQRRTLEMTDSWERLTRAIGHLTRVPDIDADLRSHLLDLVDTEFETRPGNSSGDSLPLIGSIHSWLSTFGFIRHKDHPGNVFFHQSDLVGDAPPIVPGMLVEFSLASDSERVRASSVQVRTQVIE